MKKLTDEQFNDILDKFDSLRGTNGKVVLTEEQIKQVLVAREIKPAVSYAILERVWKELGWDLSADTIRRRYLEQRSEWLKKYGDWLESYKLERILETDENF